MYLMQIVGINSITIRSAYIRISLPVPVTTATNWHCVFLELRMVQLLNIFFIAKTTISAYVDNK